MSDVRPRLALALLVALAIALPTTALATLSDTDAGAEESAPVLVEVPAVKVCMVNDQLFEKDQIPVEVEGKTYYGCCDMCKERLAVDAAIRTAIDPHTGAEVDKATAFKAARRDGAILYFESEETFQALLQQLGASAAAP